MFTPAPKGKRKKNEKKTRLKTKINWGNKGLEEKSSPKNFKSGEKIFACFKS
jgi:hypothetical protein